MKVVAYCIDKDEKILLAKANGKKHDITLISNAMNADTINYANGKAAVILCSGNMEADLLSEFISTGVQLIITKFNVDRNLIEKAHNFGICIISLQSTVLNYTDVIRILDTWQVGKNVRI